MQLIKNNPYRIVGLLVGATARDQERQIKQLKQFIEADQAPKDDFSFPILGNISRTVESVNDAASKLNLGSDKVQAALFWFYKGNLITDEPALDAIRESDVQRSKDIWSKLITSGVVTQRNSSAFQNLSTLLLYNAFDCKPININLLEESIALKLKFLDSNFANEFKELATDVTYKVNNTEIQSLFLNLLYSEIEKTDGIDIVKFLEIVSNQDFSGKEDFIKIFIHKPFEQIEKKILDSKTKRKANKADSFVIGDNLYKQIFNSLSQLKLLLGISNIKFSSISDKASEEILQCGIDYFMHFRDSDRFTGSGSMNLMLKAKSLAIGNIAKQRCQENTNNLQDWIDDKPTREKQKLIKEDIDALVSLLELKGTIIDNAKSLLSFAKTHLDNVKLALGYSDELYLELSTQIAAKAQDMCITEINESNEHFIKANNNIGKVAILLFLKDQLPRALAVFITIAEMDLKQDFRIIFNKNRESISQLEAYAANFNLDARNNTSNSSSGGCYIATMAYGCYDHPQVMMLRQFRDQVLVNYFWGRRFIKVYYKYSPSLVIKLKDKKAINFIIRKLLNHFIKLI